jgi:glycine oxidase
MNIGIAGAGIMGRLMAFYLVNAGYHVTLFDKSETMNCSMSAAGLLTPIAELEKCDMMIYQMGIESLTNYWPAILKHLPCDIYFRQLGSLLIAHARDYPELKRFAEHLIAKTPDKNILIQLTQDNIAQFEPHLKKFHDGYYLPNEGQLDNQQVMIALEHYLLARNVRWLRHSNVTHTSSHNIHTLHQTDFFDLVIDARGLGAKMQFDHLRGIRGELVWLHAPEVQINRPVRFLHPRYGLYMVPRPNHIYIVGATEIETEDYSSISVQTLLELLTACFSISSYFKQARILKSLTQCRPTLPHHRPEIKVSKGLIEINGLYRHGFLIAPTLAFEVMQWIDHGKTSLHYPTLWRQAA